MPRVHVSRDVLNAAIDLFEVTVMYEDGRESPLIDPDDVCGFCGRPGEHAVCNKP